MFFKKLFYCTLAFLPMVIAAEPVPVTPKIDPVISFQQNMDKYNFLTQEQKEFYAGIPPLNAVEDYLKKTEVLKTLQENEINLEDIKNLAKEFFGKFLAKSQHSNRLILIVNTVIDKGEYVYSEQFSDVVELSQSFPIYSGKNIPASLIAITNDGDAEKEISRVMTVILDLLEGNDPNDKTKFADTNETNAFKSKYLDPDKIEENFKILVVYNNRITAFVTLIHETAHILDTAMRLLNNWLSHTVRTNSESVSLLFETLAYHEWNPKFVQVSMYLRITDVYTSMIQADFISRLKAANVRTAEEIDAFYTKEAPHVMEDWTSSLAPLNDNYNYVNFNSSQISKMTDFSTATDTGFKGYLPHTVRAHFMVRQILNGTEFNFDEEIKKLIHEKAPAVTCAELAEIFKEKI